MTLTIREGGYYWRRDGVREGPMKRRAAETIGKGVFVWTAPSGEIWTCDGGWHSRLDWNIRDLVAEAPAGDGWVFWRGGEYPVAPETLVEVQLRDGAIMQRAAKQFVWRDFGTSRDMIAYRVIRPAPAEPPCDGKQRTLEEAEAEASSLKIAFDEARQQLAEKDARIKELEKALERRVLKESDLQVRVDYLTHQNECLRKQLYTATTTPPAEQPKRKAETFAEWFDNHGRGVFVKSDGGGLCCMPTAEDISEYLKQLEQRLGREGE